MKNHNHRKHLTVILLLLIGSLLMATAQSAAPRPDPEKVAAEHRKLLIKYGFRQAAEAQPPEGALEYLRRIANSVMAFLSRYGIVVIIVIIILYILLLWSMFKDVPSSFTNDRARKRQGYREEPEKTETTPAGTLYTGAMAYAGQGDFERALSILHQLTIRKIVAAGLVPPADHFTNNELRKRIPQSHRFYRPFDILAAASELATFKKEPLDIVSFEQLKSSYDAVFGADR